MCEPKISRAMAIVRSISSNGFPGTSAMGLSRLAPKFRTSTPLKCPHRPFGHARCAARCARQAFQRQKPARFGKNTFRLIAQAKKRLFATGCAALFSHREDLIRCHEMRAGLAGILAERALAAVIAAQRGQGNENFFGEGDDNSLPLSAEYGCSG